MLGADAGCSVPKARLEWRADGDETHVIRSRWFAPAIIFLVCWTLTTHGKYSASGDEPHYLMVCQSLWADRDLDLSNNYQNNDGRLFGAAGLLMEQHARPNRAGRSWRGGVVECSSAPPRM